MFVLSLLLLAVLVRPPAAGAQEAPRPLRILQVIVGADGKSVKGYVSLYDAHGKPILGQASFDTQIDGKGAHLSSVLPVVEEDAGLEILMLIDVSGSMEGDKLAQARSAAASFIDGLLPKDTVALVPFAGELPATAAFTGDHAVLARTIAGIGIAAAPGTALYDVVVSGSVLVKSAPGQRRAIVLLTDGQDSGDISTHTRDQAFDAASKAQLPIYAIGVGADADIEFLRTVAEKSGGHFYQAPAPADIQGIFSDLGQSLRSEYVLTVPLSAASTANRTLVVSTSLDGTVVSDEFPFLAPQARLPAADKSSSGTPPYVWLIAGAVGVVVLGLAARGWLRRRPRRRRGALRGGPVSKGEMHLPAPQQAEHAVIEALRGKLLVVAGPNAGISVRVGEAPIEIGSGPSCGLRIDAEDGAVAGVHARVWLRSERLMVHHLARGAQTLLGGRPIEWASLEAGDRIAIGPHVISFYIEQP